MEAEMSDPFIVRIVGEDEENGVYTIAVADSPEPSGESQCVMFQHRNDYTAEEEALGTHCIVRDPGQWTERGAALAWGLQDGKLAIRLKGQAAINLEADEDGALRFDLREATQADIDKLEKGLTRVLAGVPRDDSLAA
jgi:hypothetical protein